MPATSTGRGAQVILTGQVRRAARGSAANTLVENSRIKADLERAGLISDGSIPDGRTYSGGPAHDVFVVAPEAELDGGFGSQPITATGGTVPRTLADRFAETVNVKDFGAVGDGVTDDYAAITAAMAAASSGTENIVYFPPSTRDYMLSRSVSLPIGVTLFAYPGTVTLKPLATNTSTVVLLGSSNAGNNFIYGLTLDGGGQDFGTSNNVVQAFNSTNVVLDHCRIQNTRGIAFLLSSNVTHCGARDCTFTNIGNHWKTSALANDRRQACAWTGGTVDTNYGCFVQRCTFMDIGLDPISCGSQGDFLAEGNSFYMDNGWLDFVWTVGPTAGNGAIYSTGSRSIIARGNRIFAASGNGIDILDTNYVLISDNYIRGCGQAGIGVFAASSGVISGNIITNNGRWSPSLYKGGITLTGLLGKVTLVGNIVTDDQATKTQLYGVQGSFAGAANPLNLNAVRADGSNHFGGNAASDFGLSLVGPSHGQSRDNRIINPCFVFDQANEGAVYTGGGGAKNLMDGWRQTQTAVGYTAQRSTAVAFEGCGGTSALMTVTTTQAAAAGDVYVFVHRIEGDDLQDLAFGTLRAKPLLLCFWAQSSIAGTYSAALINQTPSRGCVLTYTLPANTPTYVTLQFPGDTSAAIAAGSGYEVLLNFDFGSGTNRQTSTLGAWGSNRFAATGQTAFAAQAPGATFNISGVRLFPGTADVGWVQRSRAEELALCRRRYRKTFPAGTAVAQNAGVTGALTGKVLVANAFVDALWDLGGMRPGPIVTTYNPSATNANWRNITGAADVVVAVDGGVTGAASGLHISTNVAVATAGHILAIHATADAR